MRRPRPLILLWKPRFCGTAIFSSETRAGSPRVLSERYKDIWAMAVVHRGMHRPERMSAKHAKVRRYQGASVLQAMEEVCTESLQWAYYLS